MFRRFLVTLWFGFCVWTGCGAGTPPSLPHPLLGQALEERSAPTSSGDMVKLAERGHVTVLDVWATSCKPCVAMMPDLEALWREERSHGVRVVGLATDDNPGLVMTTVKTLGVSYPQVIDADGQVRGWLRVVEVPATVVLDRAGKVRWFHRWNGAGDTEKLKRTVRALEAEP